MDNISQHEQDVATGGLGGNLYPEHHANGTRDTRLIQRAIKQRWPISEDMRGPLMQKMYDIATGEDTPFRESISATKAILEAERQNQADEKQDTPETHNHLHLHGTLDERATRTLDRLRRASQSEGQADAGDAG